MQLGIALAVKARLRALLTGVLTAASLAAVLPAASEARWREPIATAELRGVAPYRDSSAVAVLELYPRHAEVDLDEFEGLPRQRQSIFVVWLATSRNRGYIGGAFPRWSWPYGLDTIVPGRTIGQRNLRSAQRLVVTIISRTRARRIGDAGKRNDWKRKMPIRGDRVMRGPVVELGDAGPNE